MQRVRLAFNLSCRSLIHTPSLLDPKHFLLPLLGGKFVLETAIGMNGRVWVDAKDVKRTIAVARCIEAVDTDGGGMNAQEVKAFLSTLSI